MNGNGRYWAAQLVANVIVTMALLGFAWFFRSVDKSIATMVVGATLAHWLRESGSSGRTLAISQQQHGDAQRAEAVAAAVQEAKT